MLIEPTDASAKGKAPWCGITVKFSGGKRSEERAQFSVRCNAMLGRTREPGPAYALVAEPIDETRFR